MAKQRRPIRYLFAPALLGSAIAGMLLAGQARPEASRAQVGAPTPPSAPLVPNTFAQAQPIEATPDPSAEAGPLAPVGPLVNTPTRTPTPINIGNFVWDDLDADGRQDVGEPGLAGVTVQLWNSSKTLLLASDTSDANGSYTVVAPLPGDYRIRVLLPAPADQFSPKDQAGGDDLKDSDISPADGFTDPFNIASNVISTTIYDAGIIVFRLPTATRTPTPINIGNFVWVDLDADGIQDAGEPGLGGVSVQLWNSDRTALIDQSTTTPLGSYTVVAPVSGDYTVRVLLPTGASFSPKNQGADDQKDSDINRLLFVSNFGFTDPFTIASNVISTTIHDAGLINVPPTLTPSNTPTGGPPTNTPTGGPPTNTPTSTLPAGTELRLFLPLLRN